MNDIKKAQAEYIYAAYPRKVAKPVAIKAILKALTKVDAEWLLERTKEYALSRVGEPERFTPHPSTWFNQERFRDEIIKHETNERNTSSSNAKHPDPYARKREYLEKNFGIKQP